MADRRGPRPLLRHNSSSTSYAVTDCCKATGLHGGKTAVEGQACRFEGRSRAETSEHGVNGLICMLFMEVLSICVGFPDRTGGCQYAWAW